MVPPTYGRGGRRARRTLLRDAPLFALAGVTALGAAGIGGGLARIAFATTAVVTGVIYYRSSPERYVLFTLWMWILCPMVRRMVDMRAGYDPQNAISITPLAVSAIAAAGVFQRLPRLLRRSYAPFLLIGAALLYGAIAGILRNGVAGTLYTLGLWLVPVVFGLYIALEWHRYDAVRRAFVRFAPVAVLVMGVYGVIQWVRPWAWDVQWLIDTRTTTSSFGSPEPYGVRVFSTLNGPAAFGIVIGAALLLLFARPRPAHAVAGAAGGAAFLLSLCRTAWVAWVIAAIAYAATLGGRTRLRILVVGVGLTLAIGGVIIAVPLVPANRFTDIITRRVQTITNPTEDASLTARQSSLGDYVSAILDRPQGYGLGSTGLGTGLAGTSEGGAVRDFDNGVLEAFYSLGLVGGLCWMLGLGLLVFRHVARRFPPSDRFANVARAMVLFCLVAYGSTNSAAGVGGIFFWSGIGLCMAAREWAAHRNAGPANAHATSSVHDTTQRIAARIASRRGQPTRPA